MTYTVLVHRELPEEGSGYWAEVPELPGCMTSGETLDEIGSNIVDAIATWFAVKEAAGDELPAPVDFKFEIDPPQRVNASP
jgi:predicted RNase H-like HicB family nuclease